MIEFQGTSTRHVSAPPREVFDVITDIDQLPSWNAAIERVVDRPERLVAGAEWVVVMRPKRSPSWKSRSRVEHLDRDALRFVHRTSTDDNNPSYAIWTWAVAGGDGGADVTVSWEVHPLTRFRRLIAAPMRRRALAKEVPASLAALETVLAPTADAS